MIYQIEAIETYLTCPRQYKYQYIENAARCATIYEVFWMAHRKALNAFFVALQTGESFTEKQYYELWASEWESRKSAIGVWREYKPERAHRNAKRVAKAFFQLHPWTPPRSLDVPYSSSLGLPEKPLVGMSVDFLYNDAFGCYVLGGKYLTQHTADTNPRLAVAQLLDLDKEVLVINMCNRYRVRTRTMKLTKTTLHRTVACILDQIQAISAGNFPRCHPGLIQCSSMRCGYWRVCTKVRAKHSKVRDPGGGGC